MTAPRELRELTELSEDSQTLKMMSDRTDMNKMGAFEWNSKLLEKCNW
jgi:hypothetical protein